MEYKYFTLDKNPKQFKRISIGEYSIELRIEWNTRSKAWYVLGYSGDEIVISNVKMTPNQLYSIDIDSEYDLPYMIGIVPKYTNYDWDTETTFLITDNPLSNAVEGLTVDGGVIKRSIATSSDTHSRKALKDTENKYLFDVVSITQETGITIICNGADASFKTVNLPQGRWDFTINGLRTITADTESFRSLMNDYGVQIVNVGNNEYLFSNNSNQEIKIEGLYPYAAGYDFNVVESSNESAKIHSVDNNGWVNRFTVCLVPASSLIWTITSGGVSSDYQYVNFTGEKSVFESTAKLSTTQALVEKYRGGLDPYTATVVNELTGVSDWVLDPANNRVIYTPQYGGRDLALYRPRCLADVEAHLAKYPSIPKYWPTNTYQVIYKNHDQSANSVVCQTYLYMGDSTYMTVAEYPITGQEGEKYLPLDAVAQQVISNAVAGNVDAQKVVLSATLEKPLVRSLSDSNMQQWQAVKDTIGQLTGVTEWTFDNVNKVVKYLDPTEPVSQFTYTTTLATGTGSYTFSGSTPEEAHLKQFEYQKSINAWTSIGACTIGATEASCLRVNVQGYTGYAYYSKVTNSGYDPNYTRPTLSTPYRQIAERIAQNSKSTDQGIALSANLYITEALVKFTDIDSLIGQFEANKQPK